MPIYTYYCDICQESDDRILQVSELEEPQFCDCGEIMVRKYEAPHFKLKTGGTGAMKGV